MNRTVFGGAAALALGCAVAAAPAHAQEAESLKIFFDTGSARIAPDQQETLDQAARLFRDGSPYVMIVAGGADTVGAPGNNLDLSLNRARSVADGLVDLGIPPNRLQVLGRGVTDPEVPTDPGVSEAANRVVEITWR